MTHFAWPWVFAIWPAPLLLRWLWSAARDTTDDALTVPFFPTLAALSKPVARSTSAWAQVLALLFVWTLLVVATARPQRLGEVDNLPMTGRDMLLAVDISGSMEYNDLSLNGAPATRLQVVQSVAGEFIARRAGDRVGLILFGKRAYLQTPLTLDRATTRAMLDEAEIGLAGKETAIGDAIGLAVKHLRELPQDSRVLVLLTDGANTAGEIAPMQAAALAAQNHVRIYTIGVGADAMDIGAMMGAQTFNALLRPRMINPSIDLDEKALKSIADTTGGRYFRARDTQGLEEIYQLIDELEPRAHQDEIVRPVTELYYWPLSIAVLLACMLGGIRMLRDRRHARTVVPRAKPATEGLAS